MYALISDIEESIHAKAATEEEFHYANRSAYEFPSSWSLDRLIPSATHPSYVYLQLGPYILNYSQHNAHIAPSTHASYHTSLHLVTHQLRLTYMYTCPHTLYLFRLSFISDFIYLSVDSRYWFLEYVLVQQGVVARLGWYRACNTASTQHRAPSFPQPDRNLCLSSLSQSCNLHIRFLLRRTS